jgi:hypothetical protein
MAKKLSIQRILVLTAFVLSFFALSAQTTTSDTIGSGTTTSIHSALPGAYGYHLSAALYLGNEINHSAGDIESLSYHITYGNYPVNDGDKRIKIYLLETSDPFIDLSQTWGSMVSAATLVYDSLGCDIQWDDYWKEFVFTQTFSYGGGNLIVLVEGEACDPYPSMGDCETEIYVNNGTVNNCWNRVQDGTQVSFTTVMDSIPEGTHGNHYDRPNVVFSFSSGEPSTPDTNCVLTLPMLEDFEGYSGDFSSIPTCWTKISQEYNQAYGSYYPVINGGSASDPNQSMMFMLMDTYSSFLVLPALDSLWSMQNISMSFDFKSAQQNITRMVVGVMSDPSDTLTFVPVDTVWREGSVSCWEPKEINFATYADSGRHIAFWFSKANSTHVFPSCFIDNVTVDFYTPEDTTVVVDTVYVVLDESICDGESFEFGDGNYTTAGSYTYTSNDTVYTLNLTVNPTYNVILNDSITAGETYTQYGFNESAAGTYTQNLTTVNGCDSIITLNLTVLTGVNEYNGAQITIAPNPARDYVVVTVGNIHEEITLDLLDMSGRVLRTQRMSSEETTLRMERGSLPNGIYMLRIKSNGLLITRKVIFR